MLAEQLMPVGASEQDAIVVSRKHWQEERIRALEAQLHRRPHGRARQDFERQLAEAKAALARPGWFTRLIRKVRR